MFTDEEIRIIHSTCAPGTTTDRVCHATFRIMEERDAWKQKHDALLKQLGKYESLTAVVAPDAETPLPWRKRFLAWLIRD